MVPHLVAYAATASDYVPVAVTRCRSDSNAGIPASRSITTANAVALPNAITNAATNLWRAT
jgi:hypothetical protein